MLRRTAHDYWSLSKKALTDSRSATPLPLLSSHIWGGSLRQPELHLLGCWARNPSRELPTAHTSLKSVPLDAVKTIREATSPHINPDCVIILHRHRRTATAKPGSHAGHVLLYLLCRQCSPPLLQPDCHHERTKVSRCLGQSITHRLSGSPHSLHGHIACPAVFPLRTAATTSWSIGSINVLPPDTTLSSNCFASNPDQTWCLPKLIHKCQHVGHNNISISCIPSKDKENLFAFDIRHPLTPPPCIYNILFSPGGRKQKQNTWEFSYHHYSKSDKVARNTG